MKQRLIQLLKIYFLFTAVFVLMKPVFMLYNHASYTQASFIDYLQVMWHGLIMDLCVAGYYAAIPCLLVVASVFVRQSVIHSLQRIYFIFVTIVVTLIYIVDMVLYEYWGVRLDTTPVFYFLSSPADAIASVSLWFVILGIVIYLLLAFAFYRLLCSKLICKLQPVDGTLRHKSLMAFYLLLCTGLMFIPIRGGFTVSTMNLGRVYYSDVQQLNHAAINPCFSLLDSYIGERKLNHMYRYMDDKEATRLFSQMTDTTDMRGVGEEQLFTVPRPNVILVVLESFSCKIMQSMGGVPGVAVNMDSLGREGILFTNFYATSWRTDRGLASILAAYPAQPNTSIMKFTSKCDGLPMFPKEMKQVGYNLKYYYGGDVNFTSMRSFLVNAGFTDIISEKDYPLSERLGKWGAHDEYVFNRLKTDLRQPSLRQPFLKVLQTSSSHDPFDVPYHKLSNKRLNAFAYADSCLGDFVRHFRTSPLWKNTVVIFVPDHLGNYPILKRNDNYAAFRYHIPLIMVGGAVRRPMKIDTYGSQVDIAATLLSQLGLSHRKFTFSKDILSPRSPHFAFSTFPNLFVLMDRDDSVSFDCDSRKVVMESGRVRSNHLQRGKAYLQKLFDDLSRR